MTKLDDHIDTVVAWCISAQPELRDEPQAYKAALIRMGARLAAEHFHREVLKYRGVIDMALNREWDKPPLYLQRAHHALQTLEEFTND